MSLYNKNSTTHFRVVLFLFVFNIDFFRKRSIMKALRLSNSIMELEKAITKYLNWVSASYGRDTFRRKNRNLLRFNSYCSIPLKDLTIDYILDYFNSLTVSEEVLFRLKSDIKLFLKYLAEVGIITLPFGLIKVKVPVSKPTIPITFDEFQLMSKWCLKRAEDNKTYLRWWAVINVLFYTGCRRSELKIPLENVDLINKTILIKCAKGGDYRIKRYFFPLEKYLKVWKSKDYLFDLEDHAIGKIVLTLCKMCNINKPLHPHSFRAGLITFLSRKGWPIQQISEYMGQTVNVTQRYIENSPALLLDKVSETFREQRTYQIKTDRVSLSLRIRKK